ncbi:MAG: 6-oxocyclohex-1-ene-1-carbonyl-CoA hydratase [Planctomycetes bacterium]|nr:6-oxocyclohex-1-ene-1-carbonyl-CoA hydratase [Planctomycetota bacterium]MCP4769787.1 6-oxocyclohex-1-ene-1-carbonyl-CoA hydratase [Planctomycetota bacterium]MCP4859627.1 6-oxocyclohex-1-ene-1-carbonyl-CoA hydratase [Planctomycetota bacterium]
MTTSTDTGNAFANHELNPQGEYSEILFERKPLLNADGEVVEGLFNAWIALNNPRQYNSYTTVAVKELILAFRQASNDPSVVAVVFTAVEDKAFCTGGNTKDYAEKYSGRPDEYRRYMRLFNDMVSALMACDKPVINRVNGMRIGGGQEIGMACDFTVAADTARFGQAGPKHGSAPVGGSTDFLPLFVGWAKAVESCTLCEQWTAHEALHLGLINGIAPVMKRDGEFEPNPMAYTEQWYDSWGRPMWGKAKTGNDRNAAKELMAECSVDFSMLDREVELLAFKLANTMPDCTTYTLENLRKHKLQHWDANKETNRAWLSLNMMTEGRAGFRTFNYAPRAEREANFIEMRRGLANGARWNDEFVSTFAPYATDAHVFGEDQS